MRKRENLRPEKKVVVATQSLSLDVLVVKKFGGIYCKAQSVSIEPFAERVQPARNFSVVADHNMFTARAAKSTTIASEISDCTIIKPFAHRVSGAVSVGENAVLVLKAMNK